MPQPGSEDATTGYSQYDFSLDAASRQVSESADGRKILRDFIHATLGFPELARKTGIPVKTLHPIFGLRGNPTAANLFNIITCLQEHEGVRLQVVA